MECLENLIMSYSRSLYEKIRTQQKGTLYGALDKVLILLVIVSFAASMFLTFDKLGGIVWSIVASVAIALFVGVVFVMGAYKYVESRFDGSWEPDEETIDEYLSETAGIKPGKVASNDDNGESVGRGDAQYSEMVRALAKAHKDLDEYLSIDDDSLCWDRGVFLKRFKALLERLDNVVSDERFVRSAPVSEKRSRVYSILVFVVGDMLSSYQQVVSMHESTGNYLNKENSRRFERLDNLSDELIGIVDEVSDGLDDDSADGVDGDISALVEFVNTTISKAKNRID